MKFTLFSCGRRGAPPAPYRLLSVAPLGEAGSHLGPSDIWEQGLEEPLQELQLTLHIKHHTFFLNTSVQPLAPLPCPGSVAGHDFPIPGIKGTPWAS